ncbi:patatin family protein [Cystoisospora suis]|uniref:Patatin family protein n=1 Tax=Cystoisospora suis TaxID=483139 RepID=A0A2C6L5F1_9APIC|nr:patatin family protein [Cystoisospora suis]
MIRLYHSFSHPCFQLPVSRLSSASYCFSFLLLLSFVEVLLVSRATVVVSSALGRRGFGIVSPFSDTSRLVSSFYSPSTETNDNNIRWLTESSSPSFLPFSNTSSSPSHSSPSSSLSSTRLSSGLTSSLLPCSSSPSSCSPFSPFPRHRSILSVSERGISPCFGRAASWRRLSQPSVGSAHGRKEKRDTGIPILKTRADHARGRESSLCFRRSRGKRRQAEGVRQRRSCFLKFFPAVLLSSLRCGKKRKCGGGSTNSLPFSVSASFSSSSLYMPSSDDATASSLLLSSLCSSSSLFSSSLLPSLVISPGSERDEEYTGVNIREISANPFIFSLLSSRLLAPHTSSVSSLFSSPSSPVQASRQDSSDRTRDACQERGCLNYQNASSVDHWKARCDEEYPFSHVGRSERGDITEVSSSRSRRRHHHYFVEARQEAKEPQHVGDSRKATETAFDRSLIQNYSECVSQVLLEEEKINSSITRQLSAWGEEGTQNDERETVTTMSSGSGCEEGYERSSNKKTLQEDAIHQVVSLEDHSDNPETSSSEGWRKKGTRKEHEDFKHRVKDSVEKPLLQSPYRDHDREVHGERGWRKHATKDKESWRGGLSRKKRAPLESVLSASAASFPSSPFSCAPRRGRQREQEGLSCFTPSRFLMSSFHATHRLSQQDDLTRKEAAQRLYASGGDGARGGEEPEENKDFEERSKWLGGDKNDDKCSGRSRGPNTAENDAGVQGERDENARRSSQREGSQHAREEGMYASVTARDRRETPVTTVTREPTFNDCAHAAACSILIRGLLSSSRRSSSAPLSLSCRARAVRALLLMATTTSLPSRPPVVSKDFFRLLSSLHGGAVYDDRKTDSFTEASYEVHSSKTSSIEERSSTKNKERDDTLDSSVCISPVAGVATRAPASPSSLSSSSSSSFLLGHMVREGIFTALVSLLFHSLDNEDSTGQKRRYPGNHTTKDSSPRGSSPSSSPWRRWMWGVGGGETRQDLRDNEAKLEKKEQKSRMIRYGDGKEDHTSCPFCSRGKNKFPVEDGKEVYIMRQAQLDALKLLGILLVYTSEGREKARATGGLREILVRLTEREGEEEREEEEKMIVSPQEKCGVGIKEGRTSYGEEKTEETAEEEEGDDNKDDGDQDHKDRGVTLSGRTDGHSPHSQLETRDESIQQHDQSTSSSSSVEVRNGEKEIPPRETLATTISSVSTPSSSSLFSSSSSSPASILSSLERQQGGQGRVDVQRNDGEEEECLSSRKGSLPHTTPSNKEGPCISSGGEKLHKREEETDDEQETAVPTDTENSTTGPLLEETRHLHDSKNSRTSQDSVVKIELAREMKEEIKSERKLGNQTEMVSKGGRGLGETVVGKTDEASWKEKEEELRSEHDEEVQNKDSSFHRETDGMPSAGHEDEREEAEGDEDERREDEGEEDEGRESGRATQFGAKEIPSSEKEKIFEEEGRLRGETRKEGLHSKTTETDDETETERKMTSNELSGRIEEDDEKKLSSYNNGGLHDNEEPNPPIHTEKEEEKKGKGEEEEKKERNDKETCHDHHRSPPEGEEGLEEIGRKEESVKASFTHGGDVHASESQEESSSWDSRGLMMTKNSIQTHSKGEEEEEVRGHGDSLTSPKICGGNSTQHFSSSREERAPPCHRHEDPRSLARIILRLLDLKAEEQSSLCLFLENEERPRLRREFLDRRLQRRDSKKEGEYELPVENISARSSSLKRLKRPPETDALGKEGGDVLRESSRHVLTHYQQKEKKNDEIHEDASSPPSSFSSSFSFFSRDSKGWTQSAASLLSWMFKKNSCISRFLKKKKDTSVDEKGHGKGGSDIEQEKEKEADRRREKASRRYKTKPRFLWLPVLLSPNARISTDSILSALGSLEPHGDVIERLKAAMRMKDRTEGGEGKGGEYHERNKRENTRAEKTRTLLIDERGDRPRETVEEEYQERGRNDREESMRDKNVRQEKRDREISKACQEGGEREGLEEVEEGEPRRPEKRAHNTPDSNFHEGADTCLRGLNIETRKKKEEEDAVNKEYEGEREDTKEEENTDTNPCSFQKQKEEEPDKNVGKSRSLQKKILDGTDVETEEKERKSGEKEEELDESSRLKIAGVTHDTPPATVANNKQDGADDDSSSSSSSLEVPSPSAHLRYSSKETDLHHHHTGIQRDTKREASEAKKRNFAPRPHSLDHEENSGAMDQRGDTRQHHIGSKTTSGVKWSSVYSQEEEEEKLRDFLKTELSKASLYVSELRDGEVVIEEGERRNLKGKGTAVGGSTGEWALLGVYLRPDDEEEENDVEDKTNVDANGSVSFPYSLTSSVSPSLSSRTSISTSSSSSLRSSFSPFGSSSYTALSSPVDILILLRGPGLSSALSRSSSDLSMFPDSQEIKTGTPGLNVKPVREEKATSKSMRGTAFSSVKPSDLKAAGYRMLLEATQSSHAWVRTHALCTILDVLCKSSPHESLTADAFSEAALALKISIEKDDTHVSHESIRGRKMKEGHRHADLPGDEDPSTRMYERSPTSKVILEKDGRREIEEGDDGRPEEKERFKAADIRIPSRRHYEVHGADESTSQMKGRFALVDLLADALVAPYQTTQRLKAEERRRMPETMMSEEANSLSFQKKLHEENHLNYTGLSHIRNKENTGKEDEEGEAELYVRKNPMYPSEDSSLVKGETAALEIFYRICLLSDSWVEDVLQRHIGLYFALQTVSEKLKENHNATSSTLSSLPPHASVHTPETFPPQPFLSCSSSPSPPSLRHGRANKRIARRLRLVEILKAALGFQDLRDSSYMHAVNSPLYALSPESFGTRKEDQQRRERRRRRGLRILSFDGGGTRGVLSLALLKILMNRLSQKGGRQNGIRHVYEEFDLICGTSTGGVLAILLGLERATVAETERLYDLLIREIFVKDSPAVTAARLVLRQAAYDERAWEEILERAWGHTKMIDFAGDPTCPKVFCLSTIATPNPTDVMVWRNYNYPVGLVKVPTTRKSLTSCCREEGGNKAHEGVEENQDDHEAIEDTWDRRQRSKREGRGGGSSRSQEGEGGLKGWMRRCFLGRKEEQEERISDAPRRQEGINERKLNQQCGRRTNAPSSSSFLNSSANSRLRTTTGSTRRSSRSSRSLLSSSTFLPFRRIFQFFFPSTSRSPSPSSSSPATISSSHSPLSCSSPHSLSRRSSSSFLLLPSTKGSRHAGSFRVAVKDALRATTAAPGYFAGIRLDDRPYSDGALLANNPTAVAIAEARALYGDDMPIDLVVSIGTGKLPSFPFTSMKRNRNRQDQRNRRAVYLDGDEAERLHGEDENFVSKTAQELRKKDLKEKNDEGAYVSHLNSDGSTPTTNASSSGSGALSLLGLGGWETLLSQLANCATNTEAIHGVLTELLDEGTYFRFNPEVSGDWPIDETSIEKLEKLKQVAKEYFEDPRNERRLMQVVEKLSNRGEKEEESKRRWRPEEDEDEDASSLEGEEEEDHGVRKEEEEVHGDQRGREGGGEEEECRHPGHRAKDRQKPQRWDKDSCRTRGCDSEGERYRKEDQGGEEQRYQFSRLFFINTVKRFSLWTKRRVGHILHFLPSSLEKRGDGGFNHSKLYQRECVLKKSTGDRNEKEKDFRRPSCIDNPAVPVDKASRGEVQQHQQGGESIESSTIEMINKETGEKEEFSSVFRGALSESLPLSDHTSSQGQLASPSSSSPDSVVVSERKSSSFIALRLPFLSSFKSSSSTSSADLSSCTSNSSLPSSRQDSSCLTTPSTSSAVSAALARIGTAACRNKQPRRSLWAWFSSISRRKKRKRGVQTKFRGETDRHIGEEGILDLLFAYPTSPLEFSMNEVSEENTSPLSEFETKKKEQSLSQNPYQGMARQTDPSSKERETSSFRGGGFHERKEELGEDSRNDVSRDRSSNGPHDEEEVLAPATGVRVVLQTIHAHLQAENSEKEKDE